jgi:cell division septal protein FtsQ
MATTRRIKRSRLAQRRRLIRAGLATALLLSIGAVLTLIGFLLRLDAITIQHVSVSGNEAVDSDRISGVIEEALSGSYLLVVPRNSAFFFPGSSIQRSLKEEIPRLKSVELDTESFDTVHVRVAERTPYALWCGARDAISYDAGDADDALQSVLHATASPAAPEAADAAVSTSSVANAPVSTASGECYFMDENGFVFGPAPTFEGSVYFRYYGSLGDGVIGSQYQSKERFQTYQLLFQAFEESGVTPIAMTIEENGDVAVFLDSGGKIAFNDDQNLNRIVENLRTVLRADAFTEDALQRLHYIDLRFGNEVYYKFENDERATSSEGDNS